LEQTGRYRLVEQIGRTDVASVHRAYEVTGGGLVRPVTFKRMLPEHARRFEHDAVLVEEARIGEKLDHPNVVRVVDLDQLDGIWFSVEERIEGRDLATMLAKARQRGQKIDHEAALFVAIQILQGLAHAHGRTDTNGRPLGIVHRDLAPQNVWIGYDGEVRIGGFGYAQMEGRAPPRQPGLEKPRLTYVSPEQALGSELDHRADVFAVGLILWELIAGRPAYEPTSEIDLSTKARRGSVPPIRTAAPDAGAELHEAIEKATAVAREQRHGSAQVFRDELARILFKREPTYGPSHLASTVARILADEAAEDRKKDAEARALLKGRGLASLKPAAPAPMLTPPAPLPVHRPEPPPPASAPSTPAGGAIAMHEPEPRPEPARAHSDPDLAPDTFDYSVTPDEAAPARPEAPQPPPPSFPQPDLDAKPSFGKLVAGVSVLALVGVAVFAFSSEANMRLVKRKAREAVVGRKPGGQLTIESVPSGAAVFFDDEATGRTTPITIENVESQVVHVVRLELEGERPVTATVTVAANANQRVNLLFEEAIVELRVKSDPAGAEVFRNGRSLGFSPTTTPVRAGEPFKLSIKKIGYHPFEQELTPERGKPVIVDAALEKTEELLAAEQAEAEALRGDAKSKKKKSKKRKRLTSK
jgi:serine/threonine protein kinase